MIEYNILSEEDEAKLDVDFPERERGPLTTLLRAILNREPDDYSSDEDMPDRQITIHRHLLPKSYFHNPAALAQQLRYPPDVPYKNVFALRHGDTIILKATNTDNKPIRSFQEEVLKQLRMLPKHLDSQGRTQHLDVPYEKIPKSYQLFPNQIVHKLQHKAKIKCKAFQKFMRFWLLDDYEMQD